MYINMYHDNVQTEVECKQKFESDSTSGTLPVGGTVVLEVLAKNGSNQPINQTWE